MNVTGITAGTQNNVTGAVGSTEGGTGGTASATLIVSAAPAGVPALSIPALGGLILLLAGLGWLLTGKNAQPQA